jgi:hypothetical protein
MEVRLMFASPRRKLISVAVGVLITSGSLVGAFAATATPAFAQPPQEVTISLTYDSPYCATIKNNDNVSGEPIQIWQCAHAGDYHWYLVEDSSCEIGAACFTFEDAQDTSLCLSAEVNRSVQLGGCGGGLAEWYDIGGNTYIGNGYGGSGYTLSAVAPNGVTDGTPMDAQPQVGPGSDVWQQWSF